MLEKDTIWRGSVADIARYSTQAFWSGIARQQHPESTALHLPKPVGHLFQADENGEPIPSRVAGKMEKRLYVPKGCWESATGDIHLIGS